MKIQIKEIDSFKTFHVDIPHEKSLCVLVCRLLIEIVGN